MAQRRFRWLGSLVLLAMALSAGAATRNNDDSCDIAVMPAATLLLPWFEVDLDDIFGETTIFTITNVTNADAIARVTLWTDRAYPVFTFNVYLTGYDAQAINLYDVIERGIIAPYPWTDTVGTGTEINRREDFSVPNPGLSLAACGRLPGQLDDAAISRMQAAFLEGNIPGGCDGIGGAHDNAVGYATIDVVANCSALTPNDAAYWTNDIRYDNVLFGDYQQFNSRLNVAQGGPLVHIRAIPEGGTQQDRRGSGDAGFPRTFYARYQSSLNPRLDARQPLPSQFAVRWSEGGETEFETSLTIWREGRAGIGATCRDYALDDGLAVREIAVFDEEENAAGSRGGRYLFGATSRTRVDDADSYPQLANGADAGWMYVNLDRSARDDFASQGWIVSSMRAGRRYATDIDAVALGNGCSAPAPRSEVYAVNGTPIAPAPNESNLSGGTASTDNDDSCDIAVLPAATLLLPYFAVDCDDPSGETTIFTVVNVSPNDQIARVTLWTDYSFPAITFNVYLTGYDAQTIDLYDVIESGIVGSGKGAGTGLTERGAYSERNQAVDPGDCTRLPILLPDPWVVRMQAAFMEGRVPDLGTLAGCNDVGLEHDDAVGYATIDLVRNCSTNDPFSEEYWTEDLAYDNVLIGDFQQIKRNENHAQGSPLVHIRAIPEGGTSAERLALPRKYDAGFTRTFYTRFQPTASPKLDGRQPLPSLFAARWIQGSASDFETHYRIWREGTTGRSPACATHRDNVSSLMEFIRFDDAENGWGEVPGGRVLPIYVAKELPSTSITPSNDESTFPQADNGAIGGWMYFNLNYCERCRYDSGCIPCESASSNWVIASLRAEGRYTVDVDAAALGNGCTPGVTRSEVGLGSGIIGPAENVNP